MTVREELLALQKAHGGILQVARAEQWARDNTASALYASLEWDDRVAAQQHRFQQIRQLIAIHIVTDTGQRQLVSLKIDRIADGGGYRYIDDVMASPSMRQMLLEEAFADLERLRLKYEALRELADVWTAAGRAKQRQQRTGGRRHKTRSLAKRGPAIQSKAKLAKRRRA